jgi:hypothetical protein
LRAPLDYTPLHCAARGGSVEVAALLIDRGLSVSATDSQGATPLRWAAAGGQLDAGADVSAKNDDGKTPLDILLDNGFRNEELVKLNRSCSEKGAVKR